jgi:aryl-alcohol dehydrogenase (NADP+)
MEYRLLTGTGMTVSRFCLGTMMLGGRVNEEDGCEIIKYAYDNGVNFIDTADAYADGRSETIIGKAIKGIRNKIILASKVGYNEVKGCDPNDIGLSRRHIMDALEGSLKRLGTDHLDIYYIHRPIYDNPIDETLDAMYTIVRSGKARYIGVSNQASWQVCEAVWHSRLKNGVQPSVSENLYNMISRSADAELVPFLKTYNIGMVVYNPIAGGLLTGKHKFGAPTPNTRFDGNKMYIDRYWQKDNFTALEKLKAIADESGMPLVEMAIRWCYSQSHVDAIISGMTKLEQLKQNIVFADGKYLDENVLEACDDVWHELKGTVAQYNR